MIDLNKHKSIRESNRMENYILLLGIDIKMIFFVKKEWTT